MWQVAILCRSRRQHRIHRMPDTELRVSIGVSIVYSAAITVGGAALLAKNRSQSRELERLRRRMEELEG
jgi:hypothetical protein